MESSSSNVQRTKSGREVRKPVRFGQGDEGHSNQPGKSGGVEKVAEAGSSRKGEGSSAGGGKSETRRTGTSSAVSLVTSQLKGIELKEDIPLRSSPPRSKKYQRTLRKGKGRADRLPVDPISPVEHAVEENIPDEGGSNRESVVESASLRSGDKFQSNRTSASDSLAPPPVSQHHRSRSSKSVASEVSKVSWNQYPGGLPVTQVPDMAKLSTTGLTPGDTTKRNIREREGHRCWSCGITKYHTMAHLVGKAQEEQRLFIDFRKRGVLTFANLSDPDNLVLLCENCHAAFDKTNPRRLLVYPQDLSYLMAAEIADWDSREKEWKSTGLKIVRTVPLPEQFNSEERAAAGKNLYKRIANCTDSDLVGDYNLEKMKETPLKAWGGSPTAMIIKTRDALKRIQEDSVPSRDVASLKWLLDSYSREPWTDENNSAAGSWSAKSGPGSQMTRSDGGSYNSNYSGEGDDSDNDDDAGGGGARSKSASEKRSAKGQSGSGHHRQHGNTGESHIIFPEQLDTRKDEEFEASFLQNWLEDVIEQTPNLTQDVSGVESEEGYGADDTIPSMLPSPRRDDKGDTREEYEYSPELTLETGVIQQSEEI